MNYAEFQPGSRVQVEGNGEGTISWREDRASVARPNLDRFPMFTVKCDDGHTATVTPDKLTLIDNAERTAASHPVHQAVRVTSTRPETRVGGKLVGPPPDLLQKARDRTVGAKPIGEETFYWNAQTNTGVIRVPLPKDFGVGSYVCLCRHPLLNVPGPHPRAKVVEIRKASSIEPWILQDLRNGAFVYANSKQFTPVEEYAYCPFDDRPHPSFLGEEKSIAEITGLPTGEDESDVEEFVVWGLQIGEDVSVRGWGAGKIKSVDTSRKKPICVELARGTLVWTDLEHLSKIRYASMPAPLTKDDLNLRPITEEVGHEIDRLRGLVDDRLKGTQSKIDKLSAKVDLITEQVAVNNRISERGERKQQMILEILGVLEGKLGGPWLKEDERTIPGEIARVEKKLDALITQLNDERQKQAKAVAKLRQQLEGDGK